jgi:hypothetical protein
MGFFITQTDNAVELKRTPNRSQKNLMEYTQQKGERQPQLDVMEISGNLPSE